MVLNKSEIHLKMAVETGSNRGHDALPFHGQLLNAALCIVSESVREAAAIRLSTRTGKTGGRTDSGFHPSKNSSAGPHIRPWHGPMPLRVSSLAARQDACSRKRESETSSQRQTRVSGRGNSFNSGRRAKARSRAAAKPRIL